MAHHVLSPGTLRARSFTHAQSLQGRTTGTELADLTTDTSPAVDGTHCAGNSNRHHWCAHGPSQCKGKAPHLSSSHACGPRAQFVCKHAMRSHLPCESRSTLSLTLFCLFCLFCVLINDNRFTMNASCSCPGSSRQISSLTLCRRGPSHQRASAIDVPIIS